MNSEYPKYYGFILQDNDSIPLDGIVQLNIEARENSKINCVLYIIPEEDLFFSDRREMGYERTDVTDRIEEYKIIGGKVYAYQQPPDYYEKSLLETSRFVLVKDYIDLITKTCDDVGAGFRSEYDKSTLQPTSQIVSSEKLVWKTIR